MELKTLLLNEQYKFNHSGYCEISGEPLHQGVGDLIGIKINDVEYFLSRKWLSLVCHYEVDLPLEEVFKINFVECKSKVINLRCGEMMVFTKPIEFEDGFRLIPGFPGFIVNSKGTVKSRKFGRTLSQAIGPYGYPYVNIYDPDKSKWRSVSLHILLARAFVQNDDPSYRCFVNHKDGNKLNYDLDNLEWTCSRGNNIHAVTNDLRNDNKPCRVRDVQTGEEKHFKSIGQALSEIGLVSKSKKICRNIGSKVIPILFLGRYEIKHADDLTDWYYSDSCRDYSLRLNGPYQAKHIESNEVIEEKTVAGLSEKIAVSEERILTALRSTTLRNCQGYVIRVKCDDEWPSAYGIIKTNIPRVFLARNEDTSETIRFESMHKLIAKIGIDKRTLKGRLLSKKPYNGWIFEEEK
ncbi:MAG: hypothetical protein PHQ58_05140 [Rhodoferax sp.]|uniref:hypothetical protein n=1 Tax=Rhodoferax sp. TaxID=50421 RepID=UPI00262C084F|nr:hypothetical protein [Rhodoferax sp.]MDD2879800.1 hypothetical protein [Rhodoferax sp.]